jgi:hypothetical protein
VHFESKDVFNNLRAGANEFNKEDINRKRSFSFDKEQRLSRRESLVGNQNGSTPINLENQLLVPPL